MRNRLLALVAVAPLFVAAGAHAATIPFTDDFSGASNYGNNNTPSGWAVTDGPSNSVDFLAPGNGTFGCYGSGGCVDLDGHGNGAAHFLSGSTFTLTGGQTYQLQAWISGNQTINFSAPGQRDTTDENVVYGFADVLGAPIAGATANTSDTQVLAYNDLAYHLFTINYTPGATGDVRLYFFNSTSTGPSDNTGAILGQVSLTAVPLPASAWLLLSGMLGLALVARRHRAVGTGWVTTG